MPLLGDSAIQVQGFSWIMHDIWQFMKVSVNPHHYLSSKIFTHTYTHTKHYYHWWGEIILGGWRVYSLVGFDSDGTFHSEVVTITGSLSHPRKNIYLALR